ncbi:MAG TPA: Rieske 2Fe-2S domain-containing protein [Acidimicrobiales bacterium]|nr:Rieske 2Fe-2S domain-containing protein [Acidimicrobiales bacterium]
MHNDGRAGAVRGLLARPGGNLLVLRAFLGVTFTFAGLQKLANPNFFRRHAPGSFFAQLQGSITTSPLHHLLDPALHAPTVVAVVISAGEIAVGLGTLAGLFGRLAALGGMLLALSFFLTVSFNDSPYYYGADIVFLFAWTPLALGGPGELSLDALLARRAATGQVAAHRGRPAVERRAFLQRAGATAGLAALAAVVGGLDALLGRHFASAGRASTIGTLPSDPSTTTPAVAPTTTSAPPTTTTGGPTDTTAAPTTTSRAPTTTTGGPTDTTAAPTTTSRAPTTTTGGGRAPKGTAIGKASDVPVRGAASFTDPAQQIPAYVVQPLAGSYVAFSAVCTHAGCTVNFERSTEQFACPCHGSVYDARTGAVVNGPSTSPLPSIPIALGPDGELYVDG